MTVESLIQGSTSLMNRAKVCLVLISCPCAVGLKLGPLIPFSMADRPASFCSYPACNYQVHLSQPTLQDLLQGLEISSMDRLPAELKWV